MTGVAVSRGFLLAGPSGSGKTLVVNEVCRRHCVSLLVLDLSQEEYNLRNDPRKLADLCSRVFRQGIQSSQHMRYPTVILLENLDVLHTSDESGKDSVPRLVNNKHRITNHLCDLLDTIEKKKVLPLTVVGTSTRPYLIPPKMRRFGRLQQEVRIGVNHYLYFDVYM
jgi:SpoVK/Ycf46/Vps4 family AAA+-type ATPase